jgi:hypothetical protein
MTTAMNTLAAREHVAELRRVAERRRAAPSGSSQAYAPSVGLRVAGADDADLVRRLAALDDAPALEGRVLLALIDGEAVAALSLRDGRVVANPFVLTRDAVALLRLRAEHLSGAGKRRFRRRAAELDHVAVLAWR